MTTTTEVSPETADALAVLIGLHNLFSIEDTWTRGWFAKSAPTTALDANPFKPGALDCNPLGEDARCWCVLGGIQKVNHELFPERQFSVAETVRHMLETQMERDDLEGTLRWPAYQEKYPGTELTEPDPIRHNRANLSVWNDSQTSPQPIIELIERVLARYNIVGYQE